MNATQEFMDGTEWVERYAWFGAMENLQGVNQVGKLFAQSAVAICDISFQDNALMDKSGELNPLGAQYIGDLIPNISTNYTPGVIHGGSGVEFGDANCGIRPTSSLIIDLFLILLTLLSLLGHHLL